MFTISTFPLCPHMVERTEVLIQSEFCTRGRPHLIRRIRVTTTTAIVIIIEAYSPADVKALKR